MGGGGEGGAYSLHIHLSLAAIPPESFSAISKNFTHNSAFGYENYSAAIDDSHLETIVDASMFFSTANSKSPEFVLMNRTGCDHLPELLLQIVDLKGA